MGGAAEVGHRRVDTRGPRVDPGGRRPEAGGRMVSIREIGVTRTPSYVNSSHDLVTRQ